MVRTRSQQSRVIRLLVVVPPPASPSLALFPLPPYPDCDFSRVSHIGAMNRRDGGEDQHRPAGVRGGDRPAHVEGGPGGDGSASRGGAARALRARLARIRMGPRQSQLSLPPSVERDRAPVCAKHRGALLHSTSPFLCREKDLSPADKAEAVFIEGEVGEPMQSIDHVVMAAFKRSKPPSRFQYR